MAGWIKLHRDITDHWIWKNPSYLKGWITILLTVNFEDKKVLIESEVIECKRGQALLSIKSWAKVLGNGWTPQRVRTFLNLLQDDSMINMEGLRKTTRITVCNYELYQDLQQTNNEQTTSKQRATNKQVTTTKEGIKNIKEYYLAEKEKTTDIKYHQFVDYLMGNNDLNRPYHKILNMKDPVSSSRFEELLYIAAENGTSIIDKTNNIENSEKKYASFNLTLTNWLKSKPFKK